MVFTVNPVEEKCDERGGAWKQWLFSIIVYLPCFTRSLQIQYLSKIPEALPKPPNDVPWSTTATLLGALFSSVIFIWISNRFGRKTSLFLVNCIQAIVWILLRIDTSVITVMISYTLVGVTTGAIFTQLPIFVVEIRDNVKTRGTNLVLFMFLSSAGQLAMLLLMQKLENKEIMYIAASIVILQILSVFILVESPSYFVRLGKFEEAKMVLSKLRCTETDAKNVVNDINLLKDECERSKAFGDLSFQNILKHRSWRNAIKASLVVYICFTLGGQLVFMNNELVLKTSGVTISSEVVELSVSILMVASSLLAIVSLIFLEQKVLISTSFWITLISLGFLGVFMQADMVPPSFTWMPLASWATAIFGFGLAWGLQYVVLTEVLNLQIKVKVMGVLYAFSQALNLLHIHTFRYIESFFGLYTAIYIFAAINMFGAVYTIFGVPLLRNRSVKQLENKLNKIPIWKT